MESTRAADRLMPASCGGSGRPLRLIAHGMGNVFLGIAVGLLSYYGLTDLSARWRQADLESEVASSAVLTSPAPDRLFDDGTVSLDWAGYEAEDVAYWESLEDGGVFGRLVIADMGLDALVVKGHSRENLKRGPAWVDYTDLPGPTGNSGISGHRTTYGAPFRKLDALATGDTIYLYSPYRRYRYVVSGTFQVTPDRVEVLDTTDAPTLTLTACHPPYSARYRLIVQSELVEVRKIETDTPAKQE
ncbi:MAG: class E sortase [Coriobacteriia bacterium]|nr:class E sortase [Coriobacteriia bacterium]